LAITLATSAVAMILPSLITQYNWIYGGERGLAPLEERKRVLLYSYLVAVILIASAFYIVEA